MHEYSQGRQPNCHCLCLNNEVILLNAAFMLFAVNRINGV